MKDSVRVMIKSQIEKSMEKLNAARTLCKEGFIDDTISRAYYSMFHATSAVLLSEGITVDSHSALKTMFGLYFIKTGKIKKEYGRWLNRLKDDRENGDYAIPLNNLVLLTRLLRNYNRSPLQSKTAMGYLYRL